jgi:hypothetical protein
MSKFINTVAAAITALVASVVALGLVAAFTAGITLSATGAHAAAAAEDKAAWAATMARWEVDSVRLTLSLLSEGDQAPYAPSYTWECLDSKQVHNAYLEFQLTRTGRKVKDLAVLPSFSGRLSPGQKVEVVFLDRQP